jgi:phosphoribosylformylglycinamidine cyclo-ligase
LKRATRTGSLTYAGLGIDRKVRRKSQDGIQNILNQEARKYKFGKPVKLPFGSLFPVSDSDSFYDFQIEGVGTKTLLAELAAKYDTIGIDGVAMAVNDVIRSGADPLLISDAIHIGKSEPHILDSLVSGIRSGAESAGCTLASGETGDVSEILHEAISRDSLPFDLFVSCLGIVQKKEIISGQISRGDHVIGLESSGIHSNGLTMARRVLLKKWGGIYDPYDAPHLIGRPVIEELLEPTRIYVKALNQLRKKGISPRAALHVTGDGLAKFWRLLRWQSNSSDFGLKLKLSRKPAIFALVREAAKNLGKPISLAELFKTFNMGIGFAFVFSPKESERALDSLNNEFKAEKIGFVFDGRKISVESPFSDKPVLL